MRIAGVSIPTEKKVLYSLCYVHGIGMHLSGLLCEKAGVSPDKRVKDLSSDEQESLRSALLDLGFIVEADKRRELSLNIKRLQDVGCYRGYRHRRRLPCRGQNTKTNARTRRGKRGLAIAKKKVATK